MKNIIKSLSVVAIALSFASCAITMPVGATSNTVGSKVGEAKASVYFKVLAFDQDASIRTAAKNGGITKISTVDIKTTDILGIIGTYTTIVTGE